MFVQRVLIVAQQILADMTAPPARDRRQVIVFYMADQFCLEFVLLAASYARIVALVRVHLFNMRLQTTFILALEITTAAVVDGTL